MSLTTLYLDYNISFGVYNTAKALAAINSYRDIIKGLEPKGSWSDLTFTLTATSLTNSINAAQSLLQKIAKINSARAVQIPVVGCICSEVNIVVHSTAVTLFKLFSNSPVVYVLASTQKKDYNIERYIVNAGIAVRGGFLLNNPESVKCYTYNGSGLQVTVSDDIPRDALRNAINSENETLILWSSKCTFPPGYNTADSSLYNWLYIVQQLAKVCSYSLIFSHDFTDTVIPLAKDREIVTLTINNQVLCAVVRKNNAKSLCEEQTVSLNKETLNSLVTMITDAIVAKQECNKHADGNALPALLLKSYV